MTWNHRITLAAIVGIFSTGLFSALQPAASLIVLDSAIGEASPPGNPPNPQNPRVKLTLRAFQKVVSENPATGERRYAFLPLNKGSTVKAGGIIQYIIVAKNGDRPVKNLALTQPIPKSTSYVMNSARANINGELLISTDRGQTYTAEPTIDGQAANPAAYTNLRWQFSGTMPPEAKVQATYAVEVK
jgi:uncharacterized repeat protein (TIGR01451 family)